MARRMVSVLGAVAVLTVTAMVASSGESAVAAAAATARSGPGTWVQLSSGKGVANIDDPSAHRFGTSLQVVWTQETATGGALHTRILAANGAPASADQSLLQWATVNEYPSIITNGSQRVIAFSGLQNTNSTNPYAGGYGYFLTSSNGTEWTLAHATFGSATSLSNAAGADATNAAGTPVIAHTAGYGNGYRAGFDSLPPATADTTVETQPGTCCTYYTGVGYDAKSGETWMTWYSNNGEAGIDGVDAERIYPSTGAPVHGPSSTSTYAGHIGSVDPGQRVQVAARAGGGLYTAYGIGYPSQTTIALWKLGSPKPLLIRTHDTIAYVGVAAAPGGRLWVIWYDRHSAKLRAVRTNTAATTFGAIRTVATPAHTTDVWKTAGDAGNGRLDLIINATVDTSEQIFSTQVLPGLSGRVTPAKVTSARGGKITVTITDAGDPVPGATVRYGATTKRTNAHGQVVFVIVKHTTKGTKAITFGGTGYVGGTLHVLVT